MLTISKPLSAGQAQSYHQQEFTAKEQNYWSQRGVIAGEWQGRLAGQFGLAGTVSAGEFVENDRMCVQLWRDVAIDRAGCIVLKLGGDKPPCSLGRMISADAGLRVVFELIEGNADALPVRFADTLIAADKRGERDRFGRGKGRIPPGSVLHRLDGLAVGILIFIRRSLSHKLLAGLWMLALAEFRVTERDNGQLRAIQPQSLFASQQFTTAIYQSELTYKLRQLGYEITTGRSGAPEIKGYTQEYLDASSPRSQQIREYLERTGHSGKEAAEIAAHSTRDHKEIHSPGEVMAAHRKLAADFGNQAETVVHAARERSQHQEKPVNSFDRVQGSTRLTRRPSG